MRTIATIAVGFIAIALISGKSFAYDADYCSHHPKEAQCRPHHHHHHHSPHDTHHYDQNRDHDNDHSDINHNENLENNDNGQNHPD
jgi:hypothetical protein